MSALLPKPHRRSLIRGAVLMAIFVVLCSSVRAQATREYSGTADRFGSQDSSSTGTEGEREVPTAEELTDGLKDETRDITSRAMRRWQRVLRSLSGQKTYGWLLCAVGLLLGGALLAFGWSLVQSLFLPFTAAVGAAAGGYLGLQSRLIMDPGATSDAKALWLCLGAGFGLVLFLSTALKARPVTWILLVAAPFCVVAGLLLPSSVPFALFVAGVGLAAGFLAAFARRPVTVVSTALMGALMVTFSLGLSTYLLDVASLRAAFDAAVSHPLLLALGVGILVFVGADLQLLLGTTDH